MVTYSTACRACRRHLTAYIHRELSPRRRAFVSAHISGCAACYAEYSRLRVTVDELERSIPLIGARDLDKPRFDEMWRSIRADLDAPRAKPIHVSYMRRYSFAALLLMLLVLLPFTMKGQALALPTQPRPALTGHYEAGTPIAAAVDHAASPSLSATPTAARFMPDVESNLAPTKVAPVLTDTP